MKKTFLILLILAAMVLSAGCITDNSIEPVIDFTESEYRVIYSDDESRTWEYSNEDCIAVLRMYDWIVKGGSDMPAEIQYILVNDYQSEYSFESDCNRLVDSYPLGSAIEGHVVREISVYGTVNGERVVYGTSMPISQNR